jgi:hypothetical protein
MKTLIALALAGATLAAAGGASAASNGGNAGLKSLIRPQVARTHLVNRCLFPRVNIRGETVKLRLAGYSHVHYLNTKTFRPRCATFVYFSACKGGKRYKIIVRYIRGTRFVIVQRNGSCRHLPIGPVLRRS